ncbi:hypothetical protein ACP70R_022922 [Stipagrostis hirtigluma subsp. patula]
MSGETAAAGSASAPSHRRGHGSSLPAWILLDAEGSMESRRNAMTAVGETRNKLSIEMSLWPAPPPLPSKLFVFCPGATLPDHPQVLSVADDLILLRVAVAGRGIMLDDCDYFVYRAVADPERRSLELIPHPQPDTFRDAVVGILPRGGGDLYTVAALVATMDDEYILRRFDSEAGCWTSMAVSMEAPRREFPVEIPDKCRRLRHHITTTVITLGGEAGTMGWVDLWSGILLYDLLGEDQDRRTMRHIPLPLPMHAINSKAKLRCPDTLRGIAAFMNHGRASLKLAELQISSQRLAHTDIETGWPAFAVDGWSITTWSNTKMAGLYEDWNEEFTVHASEIKISETVGLQLRKSGLLQHKPSQDGEATVELALQNVPVCEPTPSLVVEEDVVYLMARTKFMHPKAWVLAVDMRNNALLGVAEFGTESGLHDDAAYRTGTISKYMSLSTTSGNF